MRKYKKQIRNRAAIEGFLTLCTVGRLGTTGADGYPRIKPLNYAYTGGKIYFHSARDGEKMDDILRDGRIIFEIDEPIGYVKSNINPCSAKYLYRSVMIKGRAAIIEDEAERLMALRALMEKYQPEGGYEGFLPEKLGITAVVCISIEEMTGKEDVG